MAAKTPYTVLTWVNDVTKLNETNLNHIEQGILNNNLLAIQNANYIEEIYAAIIEKLSFSYNPQTGTLSLKIGDLTLPIFHVSIDVVLTNYFYTQSQIDSLLEGQTSYIQEHALTIEDEEYVIDEEDR